MQYVYAAMWFVIGLLLIFRMGKENRIFYPTGAFFLFMGGWWLVDIFVEINLFASPWVWILRGVSAVMLVVLAIFYFRHCYHKDPGNNDAEHKENR